MTNKQAYKAALRPYALANDTIELMLMQHGFDSGGDYVVGNEKEFYSAVIDGLYMLITLVKEKDAGSENQYDTDKIEALIGHYRKKWDIDDESDEAMFEDLTHEW